MRTPATSTCFDTRSLGGYCSSTLNGQRLRLEAGRFKASPRIASANEQAMRIPSSLAPLQSSVRLLLSLRQQPRRTTDESFDPSKQSYISRWRSRRMLAWTRHPTGGRWMAERIAGDLDRSHDRRHRSWHDSMVRVMARIDVQWGNMAFQCIERPGGGKALLTDGRDDSHRLRKVSMAFVRPTVSTET